MIGGDETRIWTSVAPAARTPSDCLPARADAQCPRFRGARPAYRRAGAARLGATDRADTSTTVKNMTFTDTRVAEDLVRVEPVGDDSYPHVYGPINRDAVVEVIADRNLILVKGSVPGARNGLLQIRRAVKG